MYLNFFNFKEEPFSITPNPRFLFLSRQHEEAIESLVYGINERKGFMAIIGDIGTGKTTICRALLERLNKSIDTSVILNPMLSIIELLEAINDDFGNRTAVVDTVKGQLDALNEFLLRRLRWQKNAVVLIDEAQNLSTEALEMLRMLSNLETNDKKLLQILLVGQSELEEKLRSPELRQLNQRISIRYFLGPLNFVETCEYVAHRLYVAGEGNSVKFEERALRKTFDYSGGVPRIVNIVCDRALLGAYAERTGIISKDIIKNAISDVEGEANIQGLVAIKKKGSWLKEVFS